MCGISGIIGRRGTFSVTDLLSRIKHRGPDGSGVWENENVQLGHLRLSIIDLSNMAAQPMVEAGSGNIIVFNGEIYNYIELKRELASKYQFVTQSDTEVLLAAYSVYGIGFLQKLRGMFAFALYDAKAEKVLIARDRFGIKPFYYRTANGQFLFASEIKALIHLPGLQDEVSGQKAYEFIANRQLDTNNETFFRDISQLSAGHYAWVSKDGNMETPTPYWQLPSIGSKRWSKDSEEEFVNLFNETINLHLRSDVSIGSFLSGGLDSTSIACFATKNLSEKIQTYSAILPYYQEENALIKQVVGGSPKMVPHYFQLDGRGFFDDIPNVIYYHDEPILDGSMYAHYKLCELASRNGVKVLLSGSGGDELFGGYGSHIYSHLGQLLNTGRLSEYYRSLRSISTKSNVSMKDLFIKSVLENIPYTVRRKLKNNQIKRHANFIDEQYSVKHFTVEGDNKYDTNWKNNYLSWTVPPYLHYEDRNSMAFGVEIRVPFYDHILVEFIAAFNPSDIVDGRSKSIMRKSFRGVVPDAVLDQKGKYGFPSPIDHALKNDMKGREMFFDLYADVPLLNQAETRKLGEAFYKGQVDMTLFWRTLSYIIWYHHMVKSKGFARHFASPEVNVGL